MAHPLPTNLGSCEGLFYCLADWAYDVTGGLFWALIFLGFLIVLFVGTQRFGTSRAFELLPLFANRATLEGVYMQSSPSAPAVFYMQSEISKEQSCPFPAFSCSKTNISSAIKHLKMFNVNHIIAVSDEVKAELRNKTEKIKIRFNKELKTAARFNPTKLMKLAMFQCRNIGLF